MQRGGAATARKTFTWTVSLLFRFSCTSRLLLTIDTLSPRYLPFSYTTAFLLFLTIIESLDTMRHYITSFKFRNCKLMYAKYTNAPFLFSKLSYFRKLENTEYLE